MGAPGVQGAVRSSLDVNACAYAAAKWQSLAQKRQFTEVHMPDGCFVPMEGQPSGNVRRTDYATKCAEGMKLPPPGSKVTEEHRAEYPDLRDDELRAIGRVIFEKSEALWIKDTPQTMVRGFLHDMVTKGEPVSQAPLIRGGEHAEWLEAEIAKAYRRGHYVSGESNWGSPAFRVYSGASRKPRIW